MSDIDADKTYDYHTAFEISPKKMRMNVPLDINDKPLINIPLPQNHKDAVNLQTLKIMAAGVLFYMKME